LLRRCVTGKVIQASFGAAISVALTSGQAQAQLPEAWSDAREIEALAVNVIKPFRHVVSIWADLIPTNLTTIFW
jgi:hypothetical protein|tara:strand:- start:9668 stop:9889 length:222 start_codon:yes stop_codon:yes gene_type:complete